ncbi:DUF6984 family protein [Mucilaginibacter limnophilus]|uniref:DUF6984 family protein n=1 Tax=Mucilaginibacter limnophilus TaxID=1932778 RepID=UPI0026CE24C4
MPPRALREKEVNLLSSLLEGKPNYETLISQLAGKVEEMNDGGMGSLRFIDRKKNHNTMEALWQKQKHSMKMTCLYLLL